MAVSAKAQIFLEESSSSSRSYTENPSDVGIMPNHGVEFDQANYVPAGSGILMLAALGGAYLLGKRNNGRKE